MLLKDIYFFESGHCVEFIIPDIGFKSQIQEEIKSKNNK